MASHDWGTPWAKTIGIFINGADSEAADDDFYLAFNSHNGAVEFTIPRELGCAWRIAVNTADTPVHHFFSPKGIVFRVEGHSMLVVVRIEDS
jgi:pullulanase/glycogen debranching enzyme